MRASYALGALAALSLPLTAQDLCEGNGHGDAYMDAKPAYIGGFFQFDMGSPNTPFGQGILSISGGFAITTHPVIGQVCLDVFDPAYFILPLPLDGNGNVTLAIPIPLVPTLVSFPPLYGNAATFESGAWSLSKTVPLYFENPDSFTPTGNMNVARILHTATLLGQGGKDNRIKVLIAGGGGGTVTVPFPTNTTEIYDPLDRTFTPGPNLSVERGEHEAILLQDGTVLISGGVASDGTVTATCELYDPVTNSFSPTGSMSAPRTGHTATMLADGKVLVTGGLADYQNPITMFEEALDTAQNTAEIYDPATGTWSPTGNTMSSPRTGHGAVTLDDGRILVVAGIAGGFFSGFADVPSFTGTADYYDPATNLFSPAPSLPIGRGFFGLSKAPNGDVVLTGGAFTGGPQSEAITTPSCGVFDGVSWLAGGNLPTGSAFHRQVTTSDGRVLAMGGYKDLLNLNGAAFSGEHDGVVTFTTGNAIGLNPGFPLAGPDQRGDFTLTRLHDGSYLVAGGSDQGVLHDTAYVFTP